MATPIYDDVPNPKEIEGKYASNQKELEELKRKYIGPVGQNPNRLPEHQQWVTHQGVSDSEQLRVLRAWDKAKTTGNYDDYNKQYDRVQQDHLKEFGNKSQEAAGYAIPITKAKPAVGLARGAYEAGKKVFGNKTEDAVKKQEPSAKAPENTFRSKTQENMGKAEAAEAEEASTENTFRSRTEENLAKEAEAAEAAGTAPKNNQSLWNRAKNWLKDPKNARNAGIDSAEEKMQEIHPDNVSNLLGKENPFKNKSGSNWWDAIKAAGVGMLLNRGLNKVSQPGSLVSGSGGYLGDKESILNSTPSGGDSGMVGESSFGSESLAGKSVSEILSKIYSVLSRHTDTLSKISSNSSTLVKLAMKSDEKEDIVSANLKARANEGETATAIIGGSGGYGSGNGSDDEHSSGGNSVIPIIGPGGSKQSPKTTSSRSKKTPSGKSSKWGRWFKWGAAGAAATGTANAMADDENDSQEEPGLMDEASDFFNNLYEKGKEKLDDWTGVKPATSQDNMRDLVRGLEGGPKDPYNTLVGGEKRNLTDMTFGEVLQLQKEMKQSNNYASTAVGAYQVVSDTLKSAMKDAGLSENDKFTEENQDKIFDALYQRRVRQADSGSADDILHELSKEWAALPDPRNDGKSYYEGKNGNRSLVGLDQAKRALSGDQLPSAQIPPEEKTIGKTGTNRSSRANFIATREQLNEFGVTFAEGSDAEALESAKLSPYEIDTVNPKKIELTSQQIEPGKETDVSMTDKNGNMVVDNELIIPESEVFKPKEVTPLNGSQSYSKETTTVSGGGSRTKSVTYSKEAQEAMSRKDKSYDEFRSYESKRIKELRDQNPGMSISDAKKALEQDVDYGIQKNAYEQEKGMLEERISSGRTEEETWENPPVRVSTTETGKPLKERTLEDPGLVPEPGPSPVEEMSRNVGALAKTASNKGGGQAIPTGSSQKGSSGKSGKMMPVRNDDPVILQMQWDNVRSA